jgi:hypothetical protein
MKRRLKHTADKCWILHPELNPHKDEYSSTSQSSDEGDEIDGDDEEK